MRTVVMIGLLALSMSALAQAREPEGPAYTGLWLSTPYPALQVAPGDRVTLDMKVHNAGLPPQSVALSVPQSPSGWKTTFLGDGKPVGGVFVGPNDVAKVELQIDMPKTVSKGDYRFLVRAQGARGTSDLPLELTLGERPPAKLTLKPEVPILPGTPDSTFTFKITLANDSAQDALVALRADAPQGFQASFTEEFESQKLTSVPVQAGKSKNLQVEIHPPQGVEAGDYAIPVEAAAGDLKATTRLELQISGQPELHLTAPGDRLSGTAYAGEQTSLQLELKNRGTAPAQGVEVSAFPPQGWKVSFEPKRVNVVAPGETKDVRALLTPPARAIAGDYMITMRAHGDAASDSSQFRITVRTSTLWGLVGIAVIAAAVVVLALAVVRYGRR